jgi:Inorganic pyrophosphatase
MAADEDAHIETTGTRVVYENRWMRVREGSRNKYDYDPECDCLDLATVLPEGMSFPYDFGFVPSTLGEDGDPLDIRSIPIAKANSVSPMLDFPGSAMRR